MKTLSNTVSLESFKAMVNVITYNTYSTASIIIGQDNYIDAGETGLIAKQNLWKKLQDKKLTK
jgi:tRNA U34 5-carboxymethylaminomethyl modifying enzyme MnmG/GidA